MRLRIAQIVKRNRAYVLYTKTKTPKMRIFFPTIYNLRQNILSRTFFAHNII